MTSEFKVYIAGVGYSPSPPGGFSAKDVAIVSVASAGTKGLLDAGVTFDDVSRVVRADGGSHGSNVFEASKRRGPAEDKVEKGSEFDSSFHLIKDRGVHCVLMMIVEKFGTTALVLVSHNFLWRRPYLRDSAALVRQADASASETNMQASEGLHDLCRIVWTLRGWSRSGSTAEKGRLYYKTRSSQRYELSRADAQASPAWGEVEHKQDGKYRLGYNPASETREISQEDFEAVRASEKGTEDADDRPQFDRVGGDRAALAKL